MKKHTKYFLLTLFIILIIIPWGYVFGIQNEALKKGISIAQRTAGLIILTPIFVAIIYKVFRIKTFKEEIEDVANKFDKNSEQPLGPSFGQLLFLLLMCLMPIGFFFMPESAFKSSFDQEFFRMVSIGMMVLFAWMWYKIPVFTFAEESLMIESSFFHFFHINKKKIIKYEDISSVKIQHIAKMPYEVYELVISTKQDGKKKYRLSFNDDITAKIYFQFKEIIGGRINTLFRKK